MPLRWWLRQAVTPAVILGILAGLGWFAYAFSAPNAQRPMIVIGKVTGFRLGEVTRLRGEPRAVVLVALGDNSSAAADIPIVGAASCHVGDRITLARYTNHLGREFLKAGAHPCG